MVHRMVVEAVKSLPDKTVDVSISYRYFTKRFAKELRDLVPGLKLITRKYVL